MNITEIVNNNKDEKLSKKYSEVFGFDGGKLDDSSYDKISKKFIQDMFRSDNDL